MNAKYKPVETIKEFIDAIRIRVDVFVKEQGFEPGWEPDEDDKASKSFIALANKEVVATARFRKIGPKEIKIERMAVKKQFRNKEIGHSLMNFILEEIKKEKPIKVWLRSQERTQGFYKKCGFKNISEPYMEFGFSHIDMEFK